ncbi:RNA polymerase sigma factor [Rhodococcus sp. IEGM 1408]|uniref:RNA polymerase sigma factor n=1 Tax=Rhodococcus sp. IEGM 1408 TaxID=3082220 RepID=UPI0029540ECD|nr:DUF6596 domain-containing protein [Rhodococcus sp. IEGM 1408]MDV8000697.1 DUF6596 domain-containing protein [Rhodococcus sp. IEGM 1408]
MEDRLTSGTIEDVARTARPRLVAFLAAPDGDLAAAEDAVSDAIERALVTWPRDGIPDRPEAWLFSVARNRRRDSWRASGRLGPIPEDYPEPGDPAVDDSAVGIPDQRLALLAVAAHPAIHPAARTPLMLNTVLNLTAERIGAVMLVPKATMAARLTRAKKQIRQSDIPFEVPGVDELPDRLAAIREAIYAAYSVEWEFSAAEPRSGLAGEAVFLAELLTELVPGDPESHGLAALLCLSACRSGARRDERGDLVPLAAQDTSRWDDTLLERGREHLRLAGATEPPGPYRLQAAVQAVHCARRETGVTDWDSVRRLLAGLRRLAPTVGGTVALAIATAECEGPDAGLGVLDEIGPRAEWFQPALAARARLLADSGRRGSALDAYDRALILTTEPAERRYLERARDAARCPSPPLS